MPNVGSCLRVTPLEYLPPNTTSCFHQMDVGIIVFFKAQYQKLVIQYQIKYSNANKVFAIDIYQVVVMVEHAWRAGVTTLTKLLEATYILLIFIEKDKEKSNICHALDLLSRCMAGLNYNQKAITEILNVCTKHHQLLLSVDTYHPTSALGYKL